MIFLSHAHGQSSTVPCGTTEQTIPYPGTAYRFDPMIFHGDTTVFDINEAGKQLLDVTYLSDNGKKVCHRKLTLDLICSHGRIMPSVKDSDFGHVRLVKLHAITQK